MFYLILIKHYINEILDIFVFFFEIVGMHKTRKSKS